jgi:FkbM family methyltransferase
MMRRVAEKMFGRFRIVRRLPKSSGGAAIVTTAQAGGLKFLFGRARNWDPVLLSLTRRLVFPGDTVWDVGANVGLFSVAAAFRATPSGRVYSFEADIETAALLTETARINPVNSAPISVLPIAVAEVSGFKSFDIAKRARAANALSGYGSTQTGGIYETRSVPAFTLDALTRYLNPPQMLKIDVEGAEKLILEGAGELLTQIRPVIFSEVHSANAAPVARLLRSANYFVFSGESAQWTESSSLIQAPWNTVAIPVEKISKYSSQL